MTVGRHMLYQGRAIGGGGGPPFEAVGAIALWSGTLATIPAGWTLCDGGDTTPNLIARFLRGAPAATEPGTTGGADSHGHASMTSAGGHTHAFSGGHHNQMSNAAGAHIHPASGNLGEWAGTFSVQVVSGGSHNHLVNDDTHTHTVNSQGAHTHVINIADGRPLYYEVAFIQAGAAAVVALGLIIIWTGLLANIPAGWTLCDGGDTRPDMRTRFVRGVNTNITNPGGVGGADTHGHTEVNAAPHAHTSTSTTHNHTYNAYTWTHDHCSLRSGAQSWLTCPAYSGAHTHAATDSIDNHNHNPMGNSATHHLAHTVNSADSKPAYYDVAYIINTAAATIPASGVLVWTGLLANIPVGYNLCDSGGGRPELRAKFLRGSNAGVNPGGLGGSDTHTHTDQNVAAHNNHSQTSGGDFHRHAPSNTLGAHTHGGSYTRTKSTVAAEPYMQDGSAGDHSHTFNDSPGAHTHTLATGGLHNHNPWSTDDGRPAFYEVAFIMKA